MLISHCFLLYTGNDRSNKNTLTISDFPTNSGQLTVFFGETAYLNCSGLATRLLTRLFWSHSNGTLVCPVTENPYCVPSNRTTCQGSRLIHNSGCRVDGTSQGRRCKESRVQSYIYATLDNCTYNIQTIHATMVINGVTWSDSGVYTCMAISRAVKKKTMNVTVGQFYLLVRG